MSDHRASLVVGYMNDPEGMNAVRYAIALANQLNADLHVLHVVDLSDFPIDPDTVDWEESGERALAKEEALVRAEMTALHGEATYDTTRGNPAQALGKHGDRYNALMVIVGTHGDHPGAGLRRFLGGSVGRTLVRHLDRPVLVVPAHSSFPKALTITRHDVPANHRVSRLSVGRRARTTMTAIGAPIASPPAASL